MMMVVVMVVMTMKRPELVGDCPPNIFQNGLLSVPQGHQVHQLDVIYCFRNRICFLQVLLIWVFHLKDKIWIDLMVHQLLDTLW